MVAAKKFSRAVNSTGNNDAGPSNRALTTEMVYSLPASSKFVLGCTLYQYLQQYWRSNGKPYLNRTLLYQKTAPSYISSRKRKINDRTPDGSPLWEKRLRVENGWSSVFTSGASAVSKRDQRNNNAEWKPFSTKVVFDGVFDQSGLQDSVDVDVLVIKTNGTRLVADNISQDNGHSFPTTALYVSRNPPSGHSGTNGHVSPSITIPLETGVSSPSRGQKISDGITRRWLLCRCKLPLPRTARKGLRNSVQRRASAGLAPMATDYCFGCCDITEDAALGDGSNEITMFMKRATVKPAQPGENGIQKNGRIFNAALFAELLGDNELDDSSPSSMPTMQLRTIQTCVQRRRDYTQISPRRHTELHKKRSRLLGIAEKLPVEIQFVEMKRSDSWMGNYTQSKRMDKGRVYYQLCIERQRNNGAASVETCVNRLITKVNDASRCPFCGTKCTDVYCLMQHHRRCHARFTCIVKEITNGIVIETRASSNYHGRLETRVQRKRFSKKKIIPVKRMNKETKMIFYRPHGDRKAPWAKTLATRSLDEFKTSTKEMEGADARFRAELMLYHARQYYHTQTCQTLFPAEFDRDSEDEMDPEWLRNKTERMIDEFTDVNEGEKSIMKMWNLHMMKHNFFGDKQMVIACDTFLNYYGRRIVLENLTKNFLLHLADLTYFGLLSPAQVLRLTKRLNSMTPNAGGMA